MEYTFNSDQQMQAFGVTLGEQFSGGEVIELVGDVGAGKTTLTKGIARGMGITEDVQSPSYTLSRVYDTPGGVQLAHYDFYRLQDPGILADELADVVGQPGVVTVVEWADIVQGVLPANRTTIRITSPAEATRHVVVEGAQ